MPNTLPILTPAFINDTLINNRIILAPMSRASAEDDGTPTQNMMTYYESFAKGGYGLLITEGTYTDANYAQSYANQPGMVTERHKLGWQNVTQAVKKTNGKIILQIFHAGALSQHVTQSYAPSAVKPAGTMLEGYGHKQGAYDIPKTLDLNDIQAIKQGFVQAAQLAEEAGFDGVEIHCANGYLLDQFLTDYSNERDDQYGGPLQNRIRLTCEIIREIKQRTGYAFIIGVRLSQSKANNLDYFWPNGVTDAHAIFTSVADAGVHYIHLASDMKGYTYHSRTKDKINLTAYARDVTGLPVLANGGLHDIELANAVIDKKQADFIAVGKSAMVNPDLPQKIQAGKPISEFTFDVFKYGVSIEGQLKWQSENETRRGRPEKS
ncbi:NADH:flavin oxidoreductase [Paremcibacter congregatus]|uniref:Oxidoreductase n=1 Tax=Paremcibacter congregatus TaxID=2043170 RepID=A0A2G4YR24_9PROT|nr:NADH:flavin oxidoreductase [Paremcibacter congregatus]PHZ84720.1 oxidoreductase [Paremcibacter congregatus]QDE28915.1 NADH:flavin oxidoreductase [Paremcibacter congregatus]